MLSWIFGSINLEYDNWENVLWNLMTVTKQAHIMPDRISAWALAPSSLCSVQFLICSWSYCNFFQIRLANCLTLRDGRICLDLSSIELQNPFAVYLPQIIISTYVFLHFQLQSILLFKTGHLPLLTFKYSFIFHRKENFFIQMSSIKNKSTQKIAIIIS